MTVRLLSASSVLMQHPISTPPPPFLSLGHGTSAKFPGGWNAASERAGAKLLSAHTGARHAQGLLSDDKDACATHTHIFSSLSPPLFVLWLAPLFPNHAFSRLLARRLSSLSPPDLLTPCAAPGPGFVVQLGGAVRVTHVTLSHHEFFASRFARFDVFASSLLPPPPAASPPHHHTPAADGGATSHSAPPGGSGSNSGGDAASSSSGWHPLGTFLAADVRGSQVFVVPRPAWAKALLVALRSHHGASSFCALSGFGAYGTDAAGALAEALASDAAAAEE